MSEFATLFYLLAAHALCDYPLQGDWLSRAKNPTLSLVPGEVIWPGALLCHALIHAAAVQIITGSWVFAGVELVVHAGTDYAKCRGSFGYNTDQIVHVLTKVAFFAALGFFGPVA